MTEESRKEPHSSLPGQELSRPAENPWVEVLKTIALSVVLSFGIRTFVAEARYIPTGSMLSTIQINDRLLIDKLAYRFSEPQRGDIVVFNPPKTLQEQKFYDAFIKRVIGLPGDTVEVKNNQVFINGTALEESYLDPGNQPKYEYGPVVVPQGAYWVLGDNRNNSHDSHA